MRSRITRTTHGDAHPEFPRVVVYLYRHHGGFRVAVKVKSDYHSPWTTVVRDGASTPSEARGIAHQLGTAWEKRAHAPGRYELVHGAPGA
jgi:hypothetical protein